MNKITAILKALLEGKNIRVPEHVWNLYRERYPNLSEADLKVKLMNMPKEEIATSCVVGRLHLFESLEQVDRFRDATLDDLMNDRGEIDLI